MYSVSEFFFASVTAFTLFLIKITSAQNGGNTTNGNCSYNSIDHFPSFEIPGGTICKLIIILLLVSYLFIFLVRVCEHYFVTTIRVIGRKIGLSTDVIGATLMAAAVSSPDLFMNAIGTFITEGDIGIGTIVGCGLFNTLAVPAFCIFFNQSKLMKLNSWSLSRDSLFYCTALIVLTFSLVDSAIEWHEGVIFLVLYIVYIFALNWNNYIQTKFEWCINKCLSRTNSELTPLILKSNSIVSLGSQDDEWQCPNNANSTFFGVIWAIITYPADQIIYLTVPHPENKVSGYRLYPISLIMCLGWIGIVSYIAAWMLTVAGYELGIPDSVVGMTFIAIGVSVPEAASSIIVAKRGDGAMALSNSMGSSIFDTLVCLGLPWLLKAVLSEEQTVLISSKGILFSSLLLVSSVMFMYGLAAINKFRLNKMVGFVYIFIYILFAVISILLEMGILFKTPNQSEC